MASPLRIGGITPSSRFLAQHILRGIDWTKVNNVVELGAGTGAVTRYIAAKTGEDCRILAIEQDDDMRKALGARFPKIWLGERAENLLQIVESVGGGKADLVVSSLPFTVFDKATRNKIFRSIRNVMAPGGIFAAYQYSRFLDKEIRAVFPQVHVEWEMLNLPPAFIYFCRNEEK